MIKSDVGSAPVSLAIQQWYAKNVRLTIELLAKPTQELVNCSLKKKEFVEQYHCRDYLAWQIARKLDEYERDCRVEKRQRL